MRFDIYMPCDMLKPYVRHFAVSEADGESTYKVLPDTSLVIGFQYRGGLSYLDGNSETALSTSGLTGLRDSYRIFKNSTDTGSVLVFFREAGATAFFKEPIHEFFRESLSLDHFMLRSELMVLEENLCEAGADDKRIAVIEQFLISRLRPVANDELVTGALALIHSSKGNIRIKDLATHLHTSQSPLEKRFRQAVGDLAKKICLYCPLQAFDTAV